MKEKEKEDKEAYMDYSYEIRNVGEGKTDGKLSRLSEKLELYTTLILSIATLTIAWCSYQSTIWDGEQALLLARSNKLNRLSQEKTLMMNQRQTMDESVVIAFVQGVLENQEGKKKFYIDRLRPELAQVLRNWEAALHNNSGSPGNPMLLEPYQALFKKERAEIDSLSKVADVLWTEAEVSNRESDRYSLFTVVFSMVLFMGAIAPKLIRLQLRRNLVVGLGIFLCGGVVGIGGGYAGEIQVMYLGLVA